MMKNPFCFTLKELSFSRYSNFCLDFLVMQKNCLTRKIRLTSKFLTSQPGWQTIAIHILTNVSRSKDNQAMKSGQYIECRYNRILCILQFVIDEKDFFFFLIFLFHAFTICFHKDSCIYWNQSQITESEK